MPYESISPFRQAQGAPGDADARAQGQQRAFRFEPSIRVDETFTTNANFDRSSSERRADFVTNIEPGFRLYGETPHTKLNGYVYVPTYLYARTGTENNRAVPNVHLIGTAEGLDRHLYVQGTVDVAREFLSPVGARPSNPVVNTGNEYIAQIYGVTPGVRGEVGRYTTYDLHDASTWVKSKNASANLADSYTNEIVASLNADPMPFGWGLSYDRAVVRFPDQAPLTTELARARLSYAPDPQLRLSISAGHENNDYGIQTYSDGIYGIAVQWRPTERTVADGAWEHRFFGTSYHAAFEHRTPRTQWSLRASRDVSSYPQQLATLRPGDVNSLLNSLFQSQYPDPAQRQQVIDALIRTYGLPPSLTAPVSLYSQRASLVTDLTAVAGFIGARNNLYVTLYRHREEAIVGAAADLAAFDRTDDRGLSALLSTRLDGLTTLTTTLNYSRGTADHLSTSEHTRNGAVQVNWIRNLTGFTDLNVGARYQYTASDVIPDRRESAVFVGIMHRFY